MDHQNNKFNMKKLIIIVITKLCALVAIGQINVTAKIEKLSRYNVDCIYTTITNNSSDVLYILDSGMFEPKCNCILESSHLGAYFTGYSNEMKPIFERNNYPLSLPIGDCIPKIKIPVGKSYITYTRLYGNHDFYGIINDQSIAPNIVYLNARINLLILDQEQLKSLTVSTNTIKLK